MAKFLITRKAVSEIEDLVKGAGDRLILVSPYKLCELTAEEIGIV